MSFSLSRTVCMRQNLATDVYPPTVYVHPSRGRAGHRTPGRLRRRCRESGGAFAAGPLVGPVDRDELSARSRAETLRGAGQEHAYRRMREAELVGDELVGPPCGRGGLDLALASRKGRALLILQRRRVGHGDDVALSSALEVVEQRELRVDERPP